MNVRVLLTLSIGFGVTLGRNLLDVSSDASTLPRYAQCGGSGGNCDQYSCDNAAYDGYSCASNDVCQAFNESYWQCVPASPEAAPLVAMAQIAAYAQCGGINCAPVLGDEANSVECTNAAWSTAQCADSTTSCQRVDDYMWQCLPNSDDSTADSTPTEESTGAGPADASSADASASPEAEAEPEQVLSTQSVAKAMGGAKAMSAKAFGGVKAMGAKAMGIAKAQSYEETQESGSDDSDSASDDASEDDSSEYGAPVIVLPTDDTPPEEDSADTDLDLLTFAFNLECLQTALYSCALYGDAGPASAGGVTGCEAANLPAGYVEDEVKEIALAKRHHVEYLQGLLQAGCPALDLSAFTAVANAAVDVSTSQAYNALQPSFSVAASPMNIFLAGFFLEDVTVGLYQGILPSIASQDLLIAAIGMLVDNTYHAGTIRDVAAMNAASSTGYTSLNEETGATASEALTVHAFLDGLAQLRDELDNTNEDNISVSTDSGLADLSGKRSATGVPTDDSGFTFARTAGQILAICLGNSTPGTTTGLLFPEGFVGSNSAYTSVS